MEYLWHKIDSKHAHEFRWLLLHKLFRSRGEKIVFDAITKC